MALHYFTAKCTSVISSFSVTSSGLLMVLAVTPIALATLSNCSSSTSSLDSILDIVCWPTPILLATSSNEKNMDAPDLYHRPSPPSPVTWHSPDCRPGRRATEVTSLTQRWTFFSKPLFKQWTSQRLKPKNQEQSCDGSGLQDGAATNPGSLNFIVTSPVSLFTSSC